MSSEELPDEIGRDLVHEVGEPAELLASHRPVVERRMQHAVGMPQRQERLAVARRPRGGKLRYEFLNILIGHRLAPLLLRRS
jgi:hypothetical protein